MNSPNTRTRRALRPDLGEELAECGVLLDEIRAGLRACGQAEARGRHFVALLDVWLRASEQRRRALPAAAPAGAPLRRPAAAA